MYFCRSLTSYTFGPSPFGRAGMFLTQLYWACAARLWQWGDHRGDSCEKLPEASPMPHRANASWLQDRSTAGQGWFHQQWWELLSDNSNLCWSSSWRTAVHGGMLKSEKFVEDCWLWQGPHAGAGGECEERSRWGGGSGRNNLWWTDHNPYSLPCWATGGEEVENSKVKPREKGGVWERCF